MGFYNQGFLQPGVLTTRGSYDQGSSNQGFSQPGVLTINGLTIRGSYNQGFQVQLGVCVDREFSHLVRILCSDVEIDLSRSYSY